VIPDEQDRSDDDQFGIDLGPAGEGSGDEDLDDTPTRTSPPPRTLTERLANAAADREDAARGKKRWTTP